VTIEPAKVIYYGSNLKTDMKTSEEVRQELLRSVDTETKTDVRY
jgi:hypothetical protein